MLVWAGVVLIGGAGSVLRFLADGVVGSAAGRDFPVGTLAVNLSGAVILGLLPGLAEAFPHPATAWPWPTFGVNIVAAFALGYFVTRLQERLPLSSYRRPLLGTGLCGGLSTFSTMQVEILKMLDAGAWGLAAGYAAASVAAGYAAVHLATAMVRRVRVRR